MIISKFKLIRVRNYFFAHPRSGPKINTKQKLQYFYESKFFIPTPKFIFICYCLLLRQFILKKKKNTKTKFIFLKLLKNRNYKKRGMINLKLR